MGVLKGTDLEKRFAQHPVVKGVSLWVAQGEVVGLLGPNGAGKTTTFYMLVGIIGADKGRIEAADRDVTLWPLHQRARFGLSYLPQESSVFRKLSVRENLEIILEYTGLSRKEQRERRDRLMRDLGIEALAEQRAVRLSGGERRRLEIARALIRDPLFMLLDEPFAGIDPLAVDDIQNNVRSLKQKGIGVLISDHNVRETMSICDRVYLVFEGRIILEGTPEEIVENAQARQIYLGEKFSL
ncbi:MAG: LPS export ABC transporter ATP-binding protein [Desulfohalobiaceae bacterium]|nr:LPS export ABC transporter ATP-binding protein [Desulfohalobiaceae bacterium]